MKSFSSNVHRTIIYCLFDMKSSNKFNFILDNFDVIEKVNEFTNMLGSGVSKGINFVVGTRSLADLIKNMDAKIEDENK